MIGDTYPLTKAETVNRFQYSTLAGVVEDDGVESQDRSCTKNAILARCFFVVESSKIRYNLGWFTPEN